LSVPDLLPKNKQTADICYANTRRISQENIRLETRGSHFCPLTTHLSGGSMFPSVIGFGQLSKPQQDDLLIRTVLDIPGPTGSLLGDMVLCDFRKAAWPASEPSSTSSVSRSWTLPPPKKEAEVSTAKNSDFGNAFLCAVALIALFSIFARPESWRSEADLDHAFEAVQKVALHRPSLLTTVEVDGARIFDCTMALCGVGSPLPIGTKVRISGDAGGDWVFAQANLAGGEVNGVMKKPYLLRKALYDMAGATSEGRLPARLNVTSATYR
jgi:hypothetical protein